MHHRKFQISSNQRFFSVYNSSFFLFLPRCTLLLHTFHWKYKVVKVTVQQAVHHNHASFFSKHIFLRKYTQKKRERLQRATSTAKKIKNISWFKKPLSTHQCTKLALKIIIKSTFSTCSLLSLVWLTKASPKRKRKLPVLQHFFLAENFTTITSSSSSNCSPKVAQLRRTVRVT